jgi:hypothetical protein
LVFGSTSFSGSLSISDSIIRRGGITFSLTSVPGPLAGAGFPGLIFAASGGLLLLARRRRHSA